MVQIFLSKLFLSCEAADLLGDFRLCLQRFTVFLWRLNHIISAYLTHLLVDKSSASFPPPVYSWCSCLVCACGMIYASFSILLFCSRRCSRSWPALRIIKKTREKWMWTSNYILTPLQPLFMTDVLKLSLSWRTMDVKCFCVYAPEGERGWKADLYCLVFVCTILSASYAFDITNCAPFSPFNHALSLLSLVLSTLSVYDYFEHLYYIFSISVSFTRNVLFPSRLTVYLLSFYSFLPPALADFPSFYLTLIRFFHLFV